MTVGATSGTLHPVLQATEPAAANATTDLAPSDLAPASFDLFAGHDRQAIPGRLDLNEVRRLLDEGRFWTEYQPLVHARTGRTSAFEALARASPTATAARSPRPASSRCSTPIPASWSAPSSPSSCSRSSTHPARRSS